MGEKYGLVPGVQTWTIFLSCNRHNLATCLKIMSDMRKAGAVPTGLTYVELLEAYLDAGDLEGARGLLGNPDLFGSWQRNRKFERLSRQFEKMLAASPAT